jgi:hypothetical protein
VTADTEEKIAHDIRSRDFKGKGTAFSTWFIITRFLFHYQVFHKDASFSDLQYGNSLGVLIFHLSRPFKRQPPKKCQTEGLVPFLFSSSSINIMI